MVDTNVASSQENPALVVLDESHSVKPKLSKKEAKKRKQETTKVLKQEKTLQQKAEKLARSAFKSFKRLLRKELKDCFQVESMLDFALKFKEIHSFNLPAIVSNVYAEVYCTVRDKPNVDEAVKQQALLIFDRKVQDASKLPDNTYERIQGKTLGIPSKHKEAKERLAKEKQERKEKKAAKKSKAKEKDSEKSKETTESKESKEPKKVAKDTEKTDKVETKEAKAVKPKKSKKEKVDTVPVSA